MTTFPNSSQKRPVEKKCARMDCDRSAISLSKFCGQHTNNKVLSAALQSTKLKKLRGIILREVEVKNITLRGKIFTDASFDDCEFEGVTFDDCRFTAWSSNDVTFLECKFTNCIIERWDSVDNTLYDTIFDRCNVIDSQFSQVVFADETAFINSVWESCGFAGGMFSETGLNNRIKMMDCDFIQASFNQARFEQSQFIDSTFSKTTLYDSDFRNCLFDTINHDFKLSGEPKLNDFRGSVFENMTINNAFRRWNNLKKPSEVFYLSIIDLVTATTHPNYLSELTLAVRHLSRLKYPLDLSLLRKLQAFFKLLAGKANEERDYRTVGAILSAFGDLPPEYRSNTGFMLPPPNDEAKDRELHEAQLTIRASFPDWRLQQLNRLLYLLAELENMLPQAPPQHIAFIERGSIIVTILGSFKQLLVGLRSLVDLKKTVVDIDTQKLEQEQKAIEIEKGRIELENYRALKAHEVRMNDIAYQDANVELASKKLKLIEDACKACGIDLSVFMETQKGKSAMEIGEAINAEFPILELTLKKL